MVGAGINPVLVTGGSHGVLTEILGVIEGSDHTGEVRHKTGDTVGTVLDVLLHVVDRVAELNGLCDVLATGDLEVVLVQMRVVLVRSVVHPGVGETGVAVLATAGDGHVVLLGETGAEDVGIRIVSDGGVLHHSGRSVDVLAIELRTETVVTTTVGGHSIEGTDSLSVTVLVAGRETEGRGSRVAVNIVVVPVLEGVARTENGLHLRHVGNHVGISGSAKLDMGSGVPLTLLHGDEDDTVRTLRTVEGSRVGTLQDGEALDVLDVDVSETVGLHTLLTPVAVVVHIAVTHGNAVNDDERLVGTSDGRKTADVDGDSSGGSTRSRGYADTGRLTIKGGTQGRGSGGHEALGVDGADRVTELLLILADTEGGHDSTFKHLGVFLQDDVNIAAVPCNDL